MSNEFSKYLIIATMIVSSVFAQLHVYMMEIEPFSGQVITFWMPILTIGLLAVYSTLRFEDRFPLAAILVFSYTFHIIQFVRQPPGFAWNPDAPYVLQIVENTIVNGHYTFDLGVQKTAYYSTYPLLFILLSLLSLVPSFSSMVVLKYSMAVVNLLTIVTFYVLAGRIFRIFKSSNFLQNAAILMLSFDPYFHAVDSYAHYESYAIIFFPLVLLYGLQMRSEQGRIRQLKSTLAFLLVLVIALSHHFTSYVMIVAFLVPSLIIYFATRKTVIPPALGLLAVTLVLSWLVFVGAQTMTSQVRLVESVIGNLGFSPRLVGYYEEATTTYYASPYLAQLTLLRLLILIGLVAAGLTSCIQGEPGRPERFRLGQFRRRIRIFLATNQEHSYFAVMLLLFSGLSFISLFGVRWQLAWNPDLRTRIVQFDFFPVAIFAAIGMLPLRKVKHRSASGGGGLFARYARTVIVSSLLSMIFVPATVVQAFPRYFYDPTYSPIWVELPSVAPEQQFVLGRWIRFHIEPSDSTVFTGSPDGPPRHSTYVIGYGFQRQWSERLFNPELIGSTRDTGYSVFYVVNLYNLQLPDRLGRKLDQTSLQFLESHFNRICDNGVMILNART